MEHSKCSEKTGYYSRHAISFAGILIDTFLFQHPAQITVWKAL